MNIHNPISLTSPFAVDAKPLDRSKFVDPLRTADGAPRAQVALGRLDTLWINTGTLCNLACTTCYIESSPRNDALVYVSPAEAAVFLAEAEAMGTREIGFTGGEPFMNPGIVTMLASALGRGFKVLVLTNAMRPMRRFEAQLLELLAAHAAQLTIRVSLDHYSKPIHEGERGIGSWDKAIAGCRWLSENGFRLAIAGRHLGDEDVDAARRGYATLFAEHGLAVDAFDPAALVLFPEMDATADISEISESCWEILGVDPASIMCASSRMVVKRKGAQTPVVTACTLIAYDEQFTMGSTLAEASQPVMLNHPHCARFCVLGGASCSA